MVKAHFNLNILKQVFWSNKLSQSRNGACCTFNEYRHREMEVQGEINRVRLHSHDNVRTKYLLFRIL